MPESVRNFIDGRAAPFGYAALQRAAGELSTAYREGQRCDIAAGERLAAYLATRMPATYAAAYAVLDEISARLGGVPVESVLDIGAGAGAASLAAQELFHPTRITLVERNPVMLAAALELLPSAASSRGDFTRLPVFAPHDLVIASYSLGEAGAEEIAWRLWQAARVALVIIEPGSPRGFALIGTIRARLLGAGARMIAPCPGEGACPLAAPDWCHFGARVERTALHRRLKRAELNYEDEKYSYVALAPRGTSPLPSGRGPGNRPAATSRIIRRPTHQPGLITIETCTPRGIETVQLRKKDREAFRAARRARWGGQWPHSV